MGQIRVRRIEQKGRFSFEIVWSDGHQALYHLSDLQKRCPCVCCVRARQKELSLTTHREVMAKRIVSVGRYALRIEFTSGCSQGIYPFALLRAWNKEGFLSEKGD